MMTQSEAIGPFERLNRVEVRWIQNWGQRQPLDGARNGLNDRPMNWR